MKYGAQKEVCPSYTEDICGPQGRPLIKSLVEAIKPQGDKIKQPNSDVLWREQR